MKTQILEYMIAIAEEKSITKAADRLMISQAALGQQLKKLETELGSPLFIRDHHEMLLTDTGKIYINGARQALSIYYNAVEEIRKLNLSERQKITIVFNDALLPRFTSTIMPAFSALHKKIFISTIYGNSNTALNYLTNNRTDFGIVVYNPSLSNIIEYIPLKKEEIYLFLPIDHPAVREFKKNGIDFSHLQKDRFILNQTNSYMHTLEQDIFYHNNISPRILYEITDFHAAAHMVIRKEGIAFLPASMQESSDRFIGFPLKEPVYLNIMLAYPKNKVLTGPMNDLIHLITSLA